MTQAAARHAWYFVDEIGEEDWVSNEFRVGRKEADEIVILFKSQEAGIESLRDQVSLGSPTWELPGRLGNGRRSGVLLREHSCSLVRVLHGFRGPT
jgi:hypothetical protein